MCGALEIGVSILIGLAGLSVFLVVINLSIITWRDIRSERQ